MKNLKSNKFIMVVSFYLLIGIFSYLLYNSYSHNNIKILTSLNESKCEEKVSLSSDTLYFNNKNIKYKNSFKINLPAKKYTKNYTMEDYFKSYLKYNPIPEYLPQELLNKTDSNQTLYYNLDVKLIDDKFILSYKYDTKELSIVTTKINISKISSLYKVKNIRKSAIGKTKVKICYAKDNSSYMYFSEFKYKDIYFFIESKNISQEEFIKTLLSVIK